MYKRTTRTVRSTWLIALVAASAAAVGCRSLPPAGGSTRCGSPWTIQLPACPCRQPEPDAVGDGWALDRASSLRKHPGSAACFRSYPPVRTDVGWSGQQCCYDRTGSLITSGSAAGTPDRATSCRGERTDGRMKVCLLGFVNHVVKDVRPWVRRYRSWKTYQAEWPPNNANACRTLQVEVQQSGAKVLWWGEPNKPDLASDRMEQASKATGEGLPSALAELKRAAQHPRAW